MTFSTLDYLLFLPIIVVLYYLIPHKFRNFLLLLGSYFFYACYDLPLTIYIVLATAVTYFVGLKAEATDGQTKKRWVSAGVCLLAVTLGIYKYTDFVIGMFSSKNSGFNLLVPLGISFITFSAISYLVDVYRGVISAERRILNFALFMSFFPKVVQGPIVKYGDLVEQFDEKHNWSDVNFRAGIIQVIYGLFMKMVVADRLAVAVNTVYNSPSSYSGAALVFATFLFALQIYFDFAGYSLTAIGSARLLGFRFADNFRQPYFSSSVGEFWRRWHISLNKWLTDYIYIPLGGSRCSPFHRDVNLLVTFGFSGLWHGADWGYLIWGLLNGFYVVIEKRLQKLTARFRNTVSEDTVPRKQKPSAFGRIITFVLVSFAWLFFRAQSLASCRIIVKRIFTKFNLSGFMNTITQCFSKEDPSFLGLTAFSWKVLLLALVFSWVIDALAQKRGLEDRFAKAALPLRWIIYLVLIFSIIMFGMYGYGYSASAFIYAAF